MIHVSLPTHNICITEVVCVCYTVQCFTAAGYRQRWFRLKGNLLFYFKVDELGGLEE